MNKAVKIAMKITADYRYIYDPEHNRKPGGNWKMTGSGWSSNDIGNESSLKKIVHHSLKDDKVKIPSVNSNIEKEEEEVKKNDNTENLFDGNPEDSAFDTDDKGKKEEQKQTEKKDSEEFDLNFDNENMESSDQNDKNDGDSLELNNDDKEDDEKSDLDFGNEDKSEESINNTNDEENIAQSEEDKGIFDDANKDEYVNEDKYDEYIEKMNSFIEKFDEGEGKENDVTFKAIASNLDWSKVDDVKAFAEHCKKKDIEGAEEIIAFLYFQHMNDEEKFDKIVEDMK